MFEVEKADYLQMTSILKDSPFPEHDYQVEFNSQKSKSRKPAVKININTRENIFPGSSSKLLTHEEVRSLINLIEKLSAGGYELRINYSFRRSKPPRGKVKFTVF